MTAQGNALVITHIFFSFSADAYSGRDYGESSMQTALMTAKGWAVAEFGGAELHDQRRSRRLIEVAAQLAADPHGILPQSFDKWSDLKAAYRLLEGADVTHGAVLAPHTLRVREECRCPGDYLFPEDTTELDFSSHPAAEDLGPIGDGGGRGLFVHTTLAMRIDTWNADHEPQVTIPGLAAQTCWVRPQHKATAKETKAQRFARYRESQRWAAAVEQIGPPPVGTRYTFMGDREADIFETIQRCQDRRWDFIVRANQPRALAEEEGSVFDAVAAAPVVAHFTIQLRSRPRRVTRDKKTGKPKRVRKAHGGRTVELEVRACTVQVRAPQRPGGPAEPRTVNIVEAREVNAAPGDDPIHWVLLTSWACGTEQEAMRVVKAYTRRWLIEEYHKALKTGTGIEDSQLETAERIEALLGVLAVVAVRLLNRKLLATTRPHEAVDRKEVGEEVLLILEAHFGRPQEGWTNRNVLRCIARLGGFIGRKSDGEPGWITIWRGWQRLMLMVQGFNLARRERCG